MERRRFQKVCNAWAGAWAGTLALAMFTDTMMPATISSGTTVTYRRSLPDYPANQGWQLTVYLAGKSILNVAAVANGPDHDVTLTATQTAALAAGVYTWVERVVKGTEKYDVARAVVTVLADLAAATAGSLQSFEEKTLAVLEAAISGQLTDRVRSYQIFGRAVEKIPMDELRSLRNEFLAAVQQQKTGKVGRTLLGRFTGTGFDQ